ncbi:MAG: hypothetical protein P9M14_13920 [Candidatus Alcyoniella australis]|nr:hypothetical protein [Candidatus Alcyoniella australis]
MIDLYGHNPLQAFLDGHPALDFGNLSNPSVQAVIRSIKGEDDYGNQVFLGEVYLYHEGNEQLAEELFTAAIDNWKARPQGTCPHLGLGTIHFNRGNYGKALRHKELFIINSERMNNLNSATFVMRWSIFSLCRRLGLVDRALYHLERIIGRSSTRSDRALARAYQAAIALSIECNPKKRSSIKNLCDRAGLTLRNAHKRSLQNADVGESV